MANERTISWQVVADFAKTRREARATAREVENLDDAQERLNRNSAASAKVSEASTKSQIRAESAHRTSVMSTVRALNEKRKASIGSSAQVRRAAEQEAAAVAAAAKTVEATRAAATRADQARIRSTQAVKSAEKDYQRILRDTGLASASTRAAEERLLGVRSEHISVLRASRSAQTAYSRALAAAETAAGGAADGIERVGRAASGSGMSLRGFSRALKFTAIAGLITLIGPLIGLLSQLTGAAIAVISPIVQVAGALGALPQAVSVAAGAIGTLIAAFSGVGGALKAYQQQQDATRQGGAAAAKAARSQGRAIQSAERGVSNARRQAADSARNAARAVRDAERGVVDAQRNAKEAQRALNEARRQARRDLQDLRNELESAAQSEESASISLARAQERMQEVLLNPNASDLDRREATLAVEEAMTSLEQVRRQNDRAQKDAQEQVRKGVSGADQVVAARQREQEATRAVRDAYEGLRDAQRNQRQAARDSAQAISDAKAALADAKAGTDAGAASIDKYADALAKLSPEARAFVKTLISLKPNLDAIRNAAQRGLLPGLGKALVEISKLTPLAEEGFFRFGRSMATAAQDSAKFLTTQDAQRKMGGILDSNVTIMDMMGRAANNVLSALLDLMYSARPFTEWLFSVVEGWTALWKETARAGYETGRTERTFSRIRDTMETLGGIVSNLWGTFRNLGRVGSDTGDDMLKSFEKTTQGWEDWTGSVKGENELRDWFEASQGSMAEVSRMFGILTRGFFNLGKKDTTEKIIKQINDDLLPAIGGIMDALDRGNVGQNVVSLLSNVAQAIEEVVDATAGPFGYAVGLFSTFVDLLEKVLGLPGVGGVLTAVAIAVGSIAAVNFLGTITGIGRLINTLTGSKGIEGKAMGLGDRLARGIYTGFKKSFGVVKRGIQREVATTTAANTPVGNSRRDRATRRKTARAQERQRTENLAQYGYGPQGSQTKQLREAAAKEKKAAKKPGRARRAASKVVKRGQSKGEGGFVTLAPAREPKEKTSEKTKSSRRGPSAGGRAGTPRGGAAGPVGPMKTPNFGGIAKGANQAAGAVGALTLGLSFLPGPIGQAANAILIGTMVFQGLAAVFPILLKGLNLLRLAILANPFIALVAAIALVAFLVVKYWDEIKAAVVKGIQWIGNFIKSNWGIIKWVLGPLGLLIDFIIRHWEQIKGIFARGFQAVKNTVISAWNQIKKFFSDPMAAISSGLSRAWDGVKKLFTRGVDAIGKTASRIGNIFDKPGEKFRSALNSLINGANKVLRFLRVPEIPNIGGSSSSKSSTQSKSGQTRYARGGYVPGEGNRDSENALLMPGEFVLRKNAVKRIGRRRLEAMNEGRSYRGATQKFNTGGEVSAPAHVPAPPKAAQGGIGDAISWAAGKVKSGITTAYDKARDMAGNVVDLGRLGASKGIDAMFTPVRSFVRGAFGGGGVNEMLRTIPLDLMNKTVDFVKGVDKKVGSSGGGGSDPSKGFPAPMGGVRHAGVWGRYASGGSHPALDFPVAPGRSVHAIARGSVSSVRHLTTSYGKHIRVKHGAGYESIYAHLSQTLAKQGQRVGTKSTIGKSGNTGNSTGPHLHLEVRKSGRPVNFTKWMRYATGGSVKNRKKNRKDWQVPSLLTPGEFVINRDAAARIGTANLHKMNRSTTSPRDNQYHRGGEVTGGSEWGPVQGFKPGAKFKGMQALRFLLQQDRSPSLSQTWDPSLTPHLREAMENPTRLTTAPSIPSTMTSKFVSYMRSAKGKGRTATQALKYAGGDRGTLYRLWGLNNKRVPNSRSKYMDNWYRSYKKTRDASMLDLNTRIGLKTDKYNWTTSGRSAMQHVLQHSFGLPHDDLAYRPWQTWTPAEAATINQEALNKEQAEFQSYLETLSNWGLSDLVKDLLGKGLEEGMATAQSAASNRSIATRLNDSLRTASISVEDQEAMLSLVSLFSGRTDAGLRDLARSLGRSDLESVLLFEKAMSAGRLSRVPASNLSRVQSDISKFRSGTFYANTGGQVPGEGNRDTVPAMLTPGEFVIRKKAVKALGLDNLRALNGTQKFNAGGLVQAFGGGFGATQYASGGPVRPPSVRTGGGVATAQRVVNVEYKTTINNPVRENSTRSLTKSLQRRAVMNGANEFNPKEGDGE